MNTPRPTSAKIIQHAEGLGAPSAMEVRRRAAELAMIAGRREYNDEDWQQAKMELHGGHEGAGASDEMEMVALVSERDMIVTDLGHHVENVHSENGETMAEELFAEGMDEAVHEQMLASRREDAVEDEEFESELER
jgi:hypothetical protein